MEVIWSTHALASLDEIFDHIARDNAAAAERWIARLVARGESASTLPLAGRVVPERGREDVREVFERSYRIIYQVRTDAVFILVVLEGSRLLRAGDFDDLDK